MAVSWTPSRSHAPPADSLSHLRVRPAKAALPRAGTPTLETIAMRAMAEYREMPGLCLTRDQARCLWGLEEGLCDQLLAHLVDTGFLTRTVHHTYVRAAAG